MSDPDAMLSGSPASSSAPTDSKTDSPPWPVSCATSPVSSPATRPTSQSCRPTSVGSSTGCRSICATIREMSEPSGSKPMTQPRRRYLQRDDLDVESTLRRAVIVAPEIELGWSVLRQEMRDAGWPTRTPEHDRRSNTGEDEPSSLDYADPCGDLAVRHTDLAGELEALQDHWYLVATSLRAMALIARKHLPMSTPAVPACSVSTCESAVETTANGYRGMEQIAGMWVAKPGTRPVCGRHRKWNERGVV